MTKAPIFKIVHSIEPIGGPRPSIDGVMVKELVGHGDERQVFLEIIRVTDPFFKEGFGQLSFVRMYPGTAKAWHIHRKQTDWWYVESGVLKLVLHDLREGSPSYRQTQEFILGPDYGQRVVKIPPGVAHGAKALSGDVRMYYVTSSVYDPEDEGRLPHDDPAIGYDWLKEPDIR